MFCCGHLSFIKAGQPHIVVCFMRLTASHPIIAQMGVYHIRCANCGCPVFCACDDSAFSSYTSASSAKSLSSVTPMAAAEVEKKLGSAAKSQLQDLASNEAGYQATRIRKNVRDDTLEITYRSTFVICMFINLCAHVGTVYWFVCLMGTGCAHSSTSGSTSKTASTM